MSVGRSACQLVSISTLTPEPISHISFWKIILMEFFATVLAKAFRAQPSLMAYQLHSARYAILPVPSIDLGWPSSRSARHRRQGVIYSNVYKHPLVGQPYPVKPSRAGANLCSRDQFSNDADFNRTRNLHTPANHHRGEGGGESLSVHAVSKVTDSSPISGRADVQHKRTCSLGCLPGPVGWHPRDPVR